MDSMKKSRIIQSKQDRIERKVIPDSIVYSDSWHGYNALDVSDFKHLRINHSRLFAEGQAVC